MPSPQGFLSALVGSGLARDPLEFARLKAPEQAAALRKSLGLDFSDLDSERARAYELRREANGEAKRLRAQVEGLPTPTQDAPTEEMSSAELFAQRKAMEALVSDLGTAAWAHSSAVEKTAAARERVEHLEAALAAAKVELAHLIEDESKLAAALDAAHEAEPSAEAIASLDKQIAGIDEHNAAVRATVRYRELERTLAAAEDLAASHDAKIANIDAKKAKILREAKMPVEGMTVDEDGIRVGGAPFGQLSTAEQIRISATVAMAQDPAIRVLVVREGALINRANLRAIAEQAAEHGFQLWVERMQEQPSESGIHIVDGGIAYLDGEAVTQPDESADEDGGSDFDVDSETGAKG